MNDVNSTQLNSPEWLFFVKSSFAASIAAMLAGIVFLQSDLMVKGFLTMGTLYLVASTFTLAKTVRDEFEGQKLINKIVDAKTEKLLEKYARESDEA